MVDEIDDAVAKVAEAIRLRGTAPEEVITGLELLRGSIARWLAGATGALGAPEHGRWVVTPTGKQIDLTRRPTARRLLGALVEARLSSPGTAVPAAVLIAAGWDDEPVSHDAAMNRLRVAICRLRQLGLEGVIVTTNAGWMLCPDVPIVREERRTSPPVSEVQLTCAAADDADGTPSGFYGTRSLAEEERVA